MLKKCPRLNCPNWFEPTNNHGYETKFCSRSCANSRGPMSEDDKETRRQYAEMNPTGWASNPYEYGKQGKEIQLKRQGYKTEIRKCLNNNCSNTFKISVKKNKKYCSLKCHIIHNPTFSGYHPNSNRKKQSIYNGYQMDSGAELYFAKSMDKLGIKWIKNDSSWMKFFYYIFNGKKGRYYPDFYLPQADVWVEIKGKRYIRDGDEERRESVPGTILLLISNNFKKDFQKYINNILSHLK